MLRFRLVLYRLLQVHQRMAHPSEAAMHDSPWLSRVERVDQHVGVRGRQIGEAADDRPFIFRDREFHGGQCLHEDGNRFPVIAGPERGMACILKHLDLIE